MKKMKRVLSVLLSMALIVSAFAGLSLTVDAGSVTTYKIQYGASGAAYITLTPQSAENTIYYTSDGTKPTTESAVYTGRLKSTESVVFRAAEYNTQGTKVSSIKVNLKPKVKALSISIVDFDDSSKFVSISTQTEGAQIYYTTDGSTPSSQSKLFTSAILITKNCTIKAVAYKDGYKRSSIKSAKVNITSALNSSTASDDADIAAADGDDNPTVSTKNETTKTDSTTDEYGLPIVNLTDDYVVDSFANDMSVLINQGRGTSNKFNALEIDKTLCQLSYRRAYEIARRYIISRPNGDTWNSILNSYSYKYVAAWQFYGVGFSTSAEFYQSLMSDADSKAQLNNLNYDKMGMVKTKVNGYWYWMLILVDIP